MMLFPPVIMMWKPHFQTNFNPQSRQATWFPHGTDIISTHGNDVEKTLFPPCDVSPWKGHNFHLWKQNKMAYFMLYNMQAMETMWLPMWTTLVFYGNTMLCPCEKSHGFHVNTIISTLYRWDLDLWKLDPD